jgi:hypothetical protein
VDATIFKKIIIFFWPWKHKTLTSKVAYFCWIFFLSAAPTAQNSPELNIRFIDSCIQWSVVLYISGDSHNLSRIITNFWSLALYSVILEWYSKFWKMDSCDHEINTALIWRTNCFGSECLFYFYRYDIKSKYGVYSWELNV